MQYGTVEAEPWHYGLPHTSASMKSACLAVLFALAVAEVPQSDVTYWHDVHNVTTPDDAACQSLLVSFGAISGHESACVAKARHHFEELLASGCTVEVLTTLRAAVYR